MRKSASIFCILLLAAVIACTAGCVGTTTDVSENKTITITDAYGREVVVPDNPQKIAASGSGSARYFAYLGVQDRLVAVDFLDSSRNNFPNETRPYMLAHPEIKDNPMLGAAKYVVDIERLLTANPEVLFIGATSAAQIETANEIQEKSGIPVVMFYVGDYVTNAEKIRNSFNLLGKILHVERRALDVADYFDATRADLEARTAGIPDAGKPTVYVCGISYAGSHGTDPTYLPFTVLHADNVAAGITEGTTSTGYAQVTKEQILAWDPDMIFVDLGTRSAAGGGSLYELANDPSYQELTAVKNGEIYTVNPHTSMNVNHETSLANAYYIGKVLYPEQFADIDPAKKADEIYTSVVGAPVYEQLKTYTGGISYQKIEL